MEKETIRESESGRDSRRKNSVVNEEVVREILGQMPIDPELARLCDQGDIESYDSEITNRFGEAIPQIVSIEAK